MGDSWVIPSVTSLTDRSVCAMGIFSQRFCRSVSCFYDFVLANKANNFFVCLRLFSLGFVTYFLQVLLIKSFLL